MWSSQVMCINDHKTEGLMWRHINFKAICKLSLLAITMLVSFSEVPGIGKHNKMFSNFLFKSYHNSILQVSDKNISTHTHPP